LFSSSVVQLLLASLASSQHSLALQAWFRFQVSSLMMPALQARTVRFRFIRGKT